VDDAVEVRQFLADTVLRGEGYDVLTATNGDDALTLARDLLPDLIIADYVMPGRTGLELLAALRQEQIEIPFILITAEGSEALAAQALRLGVSDYLIKPFAPVELIEAVERVLKEHWTRQIADHIPLQLLQTNRQLEERLLELNTLVQTGKRITSQLELQTVMNQVVRAAVSLSHAEEGTLLLVDQESDELYLYAADNGPDHRRELRLPVEDSLAGQVVKSGQALVITGDELQRIKTHYFFRDLAYIPMALQDRVIGVLGVLNRNNSRPFEPHSLQLLNILADFAAIAIENARLYAASEKERQTLDAVLCDTEDPIIVTDMSGRLVLCNRAARRAFNIDPERDIQGHPLFSLFQNQELLELFDKQGRNRTSEIPLAEGKRILNAQISVVDRVGKIAVMQDITHLKELDHIKSEFVTSVSHDLRSPLTAILGYVELLVRAGPLNDSQKQFVERINFSVQSITTLITDLLELGKIEAGFEQDREPTNLEDITAFAVESQRHQWEAKQHRIDVHAAENLPLVWGNLPRLRQMVVNLMENAIKYTPENGWIGVTLEANSSFLILRVADTGIGIPSADQPYIFDKFYRSDEAIDNYVGTGLGLSIVKSIVDQHKGRIWVDSQVGKGTTFTVMLPTYCK
jgi:two-component system NtrC family sensor kinase